MDNFIEYDSFLIVEKPQETYKGLYKDGQPYSGYFSNGDREFPRVDYYENGEVKFQYSLDIYQMALGADTVDESQEAEGIEMNEEAYNEYVKNLYKPKLNIKSVYKNGKIVDGYEYEEAPSAMFSKKIEDQNITELHIDVFAMHYYQRTSMIREKDSIIIGSPTLAAAGEKLDIRLFREHNSWIVSYDINGKNIGSKYFIKGEVENLPEQSVLFLYEQGAGRYGYGTSGFEEYSHQFDLMDIAHIYFNQPEMFFFQNIQIFFNDFVEAVINETKKEERMRPKEPEVYTGYLVTGNQGDIEKGIRFFQKDVDSYYEEYVKGNKIKKEKIDLVTFQKVFAEYLKSIRNN
ncbi:hypothetical protein ACWGOQ_0012770 [Aquimarina sp. M1]